MVCVAVVLIAGAVVWGVLATGGGSSSAPEFTGAMADYAATVQELGELIDETPFAADLSSPATPEEIDEFRDGLDANREAAEEIMYDIEGITVPQGWEKAREYLLSSMQYYYEYLEGMDHFWSLTGDAIERSGMTSVIDDAFIVRGESEPIKVLQQEGVDTQQEVEDLVCDMKENCTACELKFEEASAQVREQGGEEELEEQCEERGVNSVLDPAVLAGIGPPLTYAEQLGVTVAEDDDHENPPLDGGEETAQAFLDEFLSEWLKYYIPPENDAYEMPDDNDKLGLEAVKDYMNDNFWVALAELGVVDLYKPTQYQWKRFGIIDANDATEEAGTGREAWVFLVVNEGIDQNYDPPPVDTNELWKRDREWYYSVLVVEENDGSWKIGGLCEIETEGPGELPEGWEHRFTMPGN